MRGIVLFFLLSGMLTACGEKEVESNNEKAQSLQLVTTIKPVQAIVTAIAGEYADSYQLIPDYASPHDYSFKPSDIRKVNQAEVVFRIDEHMEEMLNNLFENLPENIKLISLAENKDIHLINLSEDMGHENHQKHGGVDFHIWTSPKNTLVMANAIAQVLIQSDPNNKSHYQGNLQIFIQQLKDESGKISTALGKHKNKPYVVFHNSWQYFAEEFQLQKPIIVNLHEGLSAGVKTLATIRKRIVNENIGCVFVDSSVSSAQVDALVEGQKVATVEIDVLGKELDMNKESYIHWLQNMRKQIDTCFKDK